jgi:hypothetical protein
MDDLQMFLDGYKPAFLYSPQDDTYNNTDISKLDGHPFILVDIFHNRDHKLFFHTDKQKQSFVDRIGIISDSPEFHKELGLVLGYPPLAVDYYIKKTDKHKKCYVTYGFTCVSSIDDLIKNVMWLWEEYRISKELKIGYGTNGRQYEVFKVGYQDINQLHIAENEIKKRSAATPLSTT